MPRGERRAWTPFYWADWLADPAVRLLGNEPRGRYIDFLAMTNQTATPGVHQEDEVREMLGYSAEEWPEHRGSFARCFQVMPDGRWVQKRTRAEARRAAEFTKNQSEKGKKGAAVTNSQRWSSSPRPRPNSRPQVGLPQSQIQEEASSSGSEIVSSAVGAEREKPPSAPPSPAFIELPTCNGAPFNVMECQVERWASLYPAVDVRQELRKMVGWLESRPRNRKTTRGTPAFVARWLAKEQDRGGRASPTTPDDPYGPGIFEVGKGEW